MPNAKVISITSGKGGVGKTSISTNLALSLSSLGKKVCVFDADASLANINILLGIRPEFTLEHLLNGEKELKQIIVDGPRGIKVIPGASGIAEFAHLSKQKKETLVSALNQLQSQFDYLIIDTAAGIGEDVLDFIRASQYSIVVITPEPTSLTDAFSLLKVLKRSGFEKKPYVLVNMAMDKSNSLTIFNRFKSAIKKYIDIQIEYIGFIQVDETIISSVSLQCPAVLLKPNSIASQCFKQLAEKIEDSVGDDSVTSFSRFWQEHITPIRSHSLTSVRTPITPSAIDHPEADLDFETAANFCIKQLTSSAQEKSSELKPLFDAIVAQHEEFLPTNTNTDSPSSIRDFYNFLEQQEYSKDLLKETIHTLEAIYHEQHDDSIESFDSSIARFFAKSEQPKDDFKFLYQKLKTHYQNKFGEPLVSVSKFIDEGVIKDSFSQVEFKNLFNQLFSRYEERFTESFKTKADSALEAATKKLDQQIEEINTLKAQLAEAKKLDENKKVLLDKIQKMASNKID